MTFSCLTCGFDIVENESDIWIVMEWDSHNEAWCPDSEDQRHHPDEREDESMITEAHTDDVEVAFDGGTLRLWTISNGTKVWLTFVNFSVKHDDVMIANFVPRYGDARQFRGIATEGEGLVYDEMEWNDDGVRIVCEGWDVLSIGFSASVMVVLVRSGVTVSEEDVYAWEFVVAHEIVWCER